ncbi:RIM1 Single-stranded DNA-binding protein RIM1 [Candida maltosa Xu316]|uniref:Uncharacterized protein n=1 Tax=Candida maltosa (strain Xu316) TaxID=1245528 RepID=M3IN30_CANMX|nr:hypothetical protein G210_1728 [Candida maltosa Xu316]
MLRSFARSFSNSTVRSNFAKTQLLGNVGNFEFRESAAGKKFVTYNLAVSHFDKESQSDVATWYRVVAFDTKQVENLEKNLRVGSKLLVNGRLQVEKYENRETGQPGTRVSIVQDSYDTVLWGKRPEGEASDSA